MASLEGSREYATLDLIITDLKQLYNIPTILPPVYSTQISHLKREDPRSWHRELQTMALPTYVPASKPLPEVKVWEVYDKLKVIKTHKVPSPDGLLQKILCV